MATIDPCSSLNLYWMRIGAASSRWPSTNAAASGGFLPTRARSFLSTSGSIFRTGCGACEMTCPAVFQLGDDGLSRVIDKNPPEAEWDAVRDAADGCPSGAISIAE